MNILAFDTSTEKFSIVIIKNNKVILKYSKTINKTYSKYLILILKSSLEKCNLSVKNLNKILVSLGPGSFTGIRLGIAAAKGLAMPYKIEIYGINNMDLLVNSINKNFNKKNIVTIIKSKKNDYYYQIFNFKKKLKKKISFFSLNNIPKLLFNKNNFFFGDLDKELLTEIKKRNILFYKNSKFNFFILKDLLKKKGIIKLSKTLNPIYVYEHYAKKK